MSWESIGSVDTGQLPGDESWIEFCQKLAIQYIKLVCGEPPPEATLGVMSHDHDLGSYTSIGVYSEYSTSSDYTSDCENALDVFNSAVSWEELKEHFEEQLFKEDEDDEENDEISEKKEVEYNWFHNEAVTNLQKGYGLSYLNSTDQLPEIEGNGIVLTWNLVKEERKCLTLMKYGSRIIWREPSYGHNAERFLEAAKILKKKYGNQLEDLVPTVSCGNELYGDDWSSIGKVKAAREIASRWNHSEDKQ